jgi:signal transduction histidine kinase
MFRRPERIEIAFACISTALLLYVAASVGLVRGANPPRYPSIVYACAALTAICVVGASVVSRRAYRAGLLLLQCILYVILLYALEGLRPYAEVLLLSLIEMHISLRLSVVRALLCNLAVLVCTTLIGVSLGGSAVSRIEMVVTGGLVVFLAEVAVYYRELLVRATNTVDFQRRSLENLAAANHSFVEHLENVEAESADRERLRITRELHDSIGYSMTNMTMMMNASRYLIRENPDKLVEYCQKTKELASSTLQETRQILYKLRAVGAQAVQSPPMFFARLCRDFGEATGVRTDCHVGNLPSAVGDRVFATLFRAVQVGLINALRHGNTGHITLAFWLTADELRMKIWNDTPLYPLDLATMGEGIGLRGIRERLETLRGELTYGPVADGFELAVTIPREETGIAAD